MNIKKCGLCGLILAIMACFLIGIGSGDFLNDPTEVPAWFGSDYEPITFGEGWFGIDYDPLTFGSGWIDAYSEPITFGSSWINSYYEPLDLSAFFGFEPHNWTPDEAPLVMPDIDTLPSKEDLIASYRNN